MAPEHENILMCDDFSEDELRQGRQRLQCILDVLAKRLPPEVPADSSVPREERRTRYLLRRDNLDALILRRTDGHCTRYLLLKKPAMSLDLSSICTSVPPGSEKNPALDGASAIIAILMMTAEETPARKRARSANGTFRLVRRGAHPHHHHSAKEIPMGLDVGYYNQAGDEVLGFRNHHKLADLLFAEPTVTIDPYDDFYVTRPMVMSILAKIEAEIERAGLPLEPLAERLPTSFKDFLEEVPEEFCFEEPADWPSSLPHYRVLLTRLLALVRHEGVLICSWSV